MAGKEVAVTDVQKQDNGSGKEVKVSFQNQSENLFYDFINFYSGKKNLDTELLDLKPGEVKNITIKASNLEGRLKISRDSFKSGVIFREGEDATEKELIPNQGEKKEKDPESEEKTSDGTGNEKNIFDKAMEGDAEPHKIEDLSSVIPDISETVKDMKEKTLATMESEGSGQNDVEGKEASKESEQKEIIEQDELNEAGNEEKVEKRSLLDSLIHPFTHPKSVKDEPEKEEEVKGREDQASVQNGEGGDSEDQEDDMLVTEKNNYSTERVTSGVINLDDKVSGGFVKGTMNLITGKTGTGKTAFCSNFILEGARQGEPGVYVTTEEREEDILEDINAMFGWDFDSLAEQDKVRVLSIKPVFPSQNMDNISRIVRSYISDLLDQVNEAIDEIDADRVVIDSVSLVQMFIQDQYMSRVALSSLMNNLREAGVTAVLVGSIPETSEGLSKEGIIEYLVDTVILLEFVPVAEDYNRTLKIRKMRRTDHETDIFPFEVTADGLKVHEAYESV